MVQCLLHSTPKYAKSKLYILKTLEDYNNNCKYNIATRGDKAADLPDFTFLW
jgi:deoxyribodipyrimidine photolyase-like uncharacterized protein